jgi:multidrug efflux pump subunit AcrA (membrane-fusion protein)
MKFLKGLIVILIIAGLAVAGIKLVKERKAEDAHQKTAIIYPINVKTITPKVENRTLTLPYLAQVKNDNISIINTKLTGRIESIKNLGDEVKKDEVVAKIDDTKLKTSLKSIESQIQANKTLLRTLISNHRRTHRLVKAKIASQEKYDNETAEIAGVKAKILSLQESKKSIINDLSYATITSPINGVVSHKFLSEGDNAFAGKPILQITPKEGNYLVVILPKEKKEIIYKNEKYLLIPLHITINGLKAYKADVNDESLVNGEKINVKVIEFNGEATMLPYKAILSLNNKNYVLVAQGNQAVPQEVTILGKGTAGVAVKESINSPIVVAEPDILLEIKSGHPIKVEE